MCLQLELCPEPHWEAYSTPSDPIAGGEGAHCPLPTPLPLLSAFGLEFWPFGLQSTPKKTWVP